MQTCNSKELATLETYVHLPYDATIGVTLMQQSAARVLSDASRVIANMPESVLMDYRRKMRAEYGMGGQ